MLNRRDGQPRFSVSAPGSPSAFGWIRVSTRGSAVWLSVFRAFLTLLTWSAAFAEFGYRGSGGPAFWIRGCIRTSGALALVIWSGESFPLSPYSWCWIRGSTHGPSGVLYSAHGLIVGFVSFALLRSQVAGGVVGLARRCCVRLKVRWAHSISRGGIAAIWTGALCWVRGCGGAVLVPVFAPLVVLRRLGAGVGSHGMAVMVPALVVVLAVWAGVLGV